MSWYQIVDADGASVRRIFAQDSETLAANLLPGEAVKYLPANRPLPQASQK